MILETWTQLKESLISTLNHLKANRFSVLTTPEVNTLRQQLAAKQAR